MDLPNLQIRRDGSSTMCVTTAVHVERLKLSMGGHLTTTALHPLFERLVHGVNTKARKPEFCMTLDQRNNPRISLGGKQVSPIRDLNNNLKAIVWMLKYNGAFSWPSKMVDLLQTDMRSNDHSGFFTWGEFRDKEHKKSQLHLVMERDENKGTARIWAMLPVEDAEIRVEEMPLKELDQESRPSASAKKKKANGGAPATTAREKKANGGAPAATAEAAAANTKQKAVEKRKKSDFDEDALVAKKAPRKEDRRRLLEEQQQKRNAGRSAGPEEECTVVVAAHPDEAEKRSSAPEEERYWPDPAFWASFEKIIADHTSHVSIDAMVAAASHVTVHNKPDTPAKAEAQERDSPAATADPMAIFAEESYWTDPALLASCDAMVAGHASHVTEPNKPDTPASARRPLVPKFGNQPYDAAFDITSLVSPSFSSGKSPGKALATPSNLFSPHPADVRVRRLEIARPAAPKASPRPAALLSSMGYPA